MNEIAPDSSTTRSSPTLEPDRLMGQDGSLEDAVPDAAEKAEIGLITPSKLEKGEVLEVEAEEKRQSDQGEVIWVEFEENGGWDDLCSCFTGFGPH
jgi:hypothetical protein